MTFIPEDSSSDLDIAPEPQPSVLLGHEAESAASHAVPFPGGDCLPSSFTEDWGDQKCLTALPYICKRSNSTRDAQPPDLLPATLGGCPSGWNQFLNKVGGGERAPIASTYTHPPVFYLSQCQG